MKKRALVISYHFFPDNSVGAKRPTELVKALIEKGWDVDVISKKEAASSIELGLSGEGGALKHYGIAEPPKVLNILWSLIKRLRKERGLGGDEKKYCQSNASDSSDSSLDVTHSDRRLYKIRKAVLSFQAILDGIKFWLFLAFIKIVLLKLSGKNYNFVLSSSPPAAVHLLALMAKKLFSAPMVLDFRDPINMWELSLPITKARYRLRLENWLEGYYFQKADLIVTTTEELNSEFSEKLNELGSCGLCETIYNGYDGDRILKNPDFYGALRMAFAGQLYGNRNPFPLFMAIKSLIDSKEVERSDILLHLYGDFDVWNGVSIPEWISDNGLDQVVKMEGFLSKKDLENELKEMHVLISFAQQQPLQIPAKTFEYLVYPAKNLVITESNSATGRFVSNNDLGYVCEDNIEDIKLSIKRCFDELGCNSFFGNLNGQKEEFSRSHQNLKYLEILEGLCEW